MKWIAVSIALVGAMLFGAVPAQANPDVIIKGGLSRKSSALDGDLQMTKDKKIVIYHDSRIRSCGNKLIRKMRWSKIRKCAPSVIRIETFLSVAKRYGKAVSIEPKGNWSRKKLKRLYRVVNNSGMLSRTQFWSFHEGVIVRWRSLDKSHRSKTGLNVRVSTPQSIAKIKRLGGRVAINYFQTNAKEVKRLQSGGIYVVIYTAFDKHSLATIQSWKPDAYYSLF